MKNILLALLNLLAIQIFAQNDVEVKIGKEFIYEAKYKYGDYESYDWLVFRNSKNEMVGFKSNDDGQILCTTYKSDMTANEMHMFHKNTGDIIHVMKNFVQLEDNLYYINAEDHKGSTTLTAEVIDIKTGQTKSDKKNIISLPNHIYSYTSSNMYNVYGFAWPFSISYSNDRSKLIVYYKYKDLVKNNNDKYAKMGVVILDKNLKTLASSEFLSTHPDKASSIVSFCLDSKNNAYLLNDVSEGKTKNYVLDMVAPNSTEAKAITLGECGDHFGMQGLNLSEDKKGDMYIYGYTAGIFSTTYWPNNIQLYKINTMAGTAKKITDAPVKTSLIKNGSQGDLNRLVSQLPDTRPKQIIFLEDGSKLLIGSSIRLKRESNTTLISYINASGKLMWTKNFMTYSLFRFPDNPFFFTKDGFYLTYFSTGGKGRLDGIADNQFILTKVTYDGEQQDQVLMDNIDKMTNVLSSPDGKTMIVEVCLGLNEEKKSVNKFVTLTLK